jgi:hypothetical protein
MTPLQQGWTHALLAGLAIVAATVLCAVSKLDANDALAIILAASGIGATGVAAVASLPKGTTTTTTTAPAKPTTPPA